MRWRSNIDSVNINKLNDWLGGHQKWIDMERSVLFPHMSFECVWIYAGMAPSANLLFSSTCRHSSSWFSCLKSLGGMSLNLFRFIQLLSLDHRHHHSLPPPPCTTLQWIWTLYSCASPQNTRVNQRNATVNHDLIVRLMWWSMVYGHWKTRRSSAGWRDNGIWQQQSWLSTKPRLYADYNRFEAKSSVWTTYLPMHWPDHTNRTTSRRA